MKLFINTTSPFVRIVRMAIIEKSLADQIELEMVDPWADAEAFLKANPAGRVPSLVTDEGVAISEAQLIIHYLESLSGPSLFPKEDLASTLSKAGFALGAAEAATAIVIGRKSSEGFDEDMVGSKRHRTMAAGLARLNDNLPRDFAKGADIGNIAVVTAIDYITFRFPDVDWLGPLNHLADWRAAQAGRPSVEQTMPYIA